MILFAVHAALANPEAGLHAVLGVGSDGVEPSAMLGAGGHVGVAFSPRVYAELRGDVGPTVPGALWAGATAGPRVYLMDRDRPSLSAYAGGGVAQDLGVGPLVVGGLAVDTGTSPGPRARFGLVVAVVPGGTTRALASAGGVFGRGKRVPVVVDVPDPVPAPVPVPDPVSTVAPEPTVTLPTSELVAQLGGEGMVWVPGPVCRWLPPTDAGAEMARLGMELASYAVISPRILLGEGGGPEPAVPLEPAPSAGRVLVAAHPGDRVEVGGAAVPVRDGVASVHHPEGRVPVRVSGGGRAVDLPVAVVVGHAVWVAAPSPEPVRIGFTVGSDALGPDARSRIAEVAGRAGDWSFEVSGSSSPEGRADDNADLARRRAEAVRDALIAAGVPKERVRSTPPTPPDPSLPPAQQRGAWIRPVEAP